MRGSTDGDDVDIFSVEYSPVIGVASFVVDLALPFDIALGDFFNLQFMESGEISARPWTSASNPDEACAEGFARGSVVGSSQDMTGHDGEKGN